MPDVVCQVTNKVGGVEFIWSLGGGFFPPYTIEGRVTNLRNCAAKTREALRYLVEDLNRGNDAASAGEAAFKLAKAGYRLYQEIIPIGNEDAEVVGEWLKDLRSQAGLVGLEIVVDDRPESGKAQLSVPWNLVYDESPDDHEDAFRSGKGPERWRPFWSVRYNLTSGRRVDPLRRLPVWTDPRIIAVVDPTVRAELHEDQRKRLDEFLADAGLFPPVGSMKELKAQLKAGFPRLLYWIGHAEPSFLRLGKEDITPDDLRGLLGNSKPRERPEGMLAFLNACQTGEASPSEGSFLETLHAFGFTGAIATEQQTIDNFANTIGLDFLEGFLREGKPLGDLLHTLRLKYAPLGLLYGAHCPPEISVRPPGTIDAAPPEIGDKVDASGVLMGTATAAPDLAPASAAAAELPEKPYPSLGFYDEADRLLFTGRDADIVRFCATLDLPDTRLLILHGESGLGKSSFLRAGVIPYLEEHCSGYRFFRGPDGKRVIVQVSRDPVGRLAQALLDMTAAPIEYATPKGEPLTIDLRPVLDDALGPPADLPRLRDALLDDANLLADLLAAMADRLPHALVLIIDQAEELFTLAREEWQVAWRDQALRLLQRVADVRADVKVIVSLRTEYYGRLLDHLREGRRDLLGVRDDLLRDFSEEDLAEAIERPTLETPLAPGGPSPRATYRFRYAPGVAETIARAAREMRTENQDSTLPLVQAVCTRLYERLPAGPNSAREITLASLDDLRPDRGDPSPNAWIKGALRAFVEDAMARTMSLGPADSEAFRSLYISLHTRQGDGTLTTWLKSEEALSREWTGPTPFAAMLESAVLARLLRVDKLRIEGDQPRSYVRLGHDALAEVAAAWRSESEQQEQLEQEKHKQRERLEQEKRRRQRLVGVLTGVSLLAVLFFLGGLYVLQQKHEAEAATKQALSRQLAAASASERGKHLDRALLLAVESYTAADTFEARESLLKALQDSPPELLCFLGDVKGVVLSVAFSPDGKTIAAGYSGDNLLGGGVVLWDAADRRRLADVPLKEGFVQSVVFSPDGKTLAAECGGGVVLWDVAARRRLDDVPLTVKESSVNRVAFSPDGKTIAAGYGGGSGGGGVVLWDAADRRQLDRVPLPVENVYVLSVAFSADGKTIAAGYAGVGGGGVVLWDAAGRKRLADVPLTVKYGNVRSVAFSADGKTIAAGYAGGVVLWDVAARRRLADEPLTVKESSVRGVAFSADGKTIAAGYGGGSADGGVMLWDAADRRQLPDVSLPVKNGYVMSVAFSRDSKILAAGYSGDNLRGGGVLLWDAADRRRLADLPLIVAEGPVRSVALSPDGKTIAAGYHGGVVLWDVAARRRLADEPLTVNEGQLGSVIFSPDSKTLAAGYIVADRSGLSGVVLWDAAGRRRLADVPLTVDEGYVMSVAFSRDSKILAAGYGGGAGSGVVLWDAADRRRLLDMPLTVTEGDVENVAFSADGKTIAAGYAGGVVLWDVAARRRLDDVPLTVNEGRLGWVAFSPDSKTLAAAYSGGAAGGVLLWDVDTKSWQRRAGQIANRNFTRDEWRQYFPDKPYRATFRDLPIPPEDDRGVAAEKKAGPR